MCLRYPLTSVVAALLIFAGAAAHADEWRSVSVPGATCWDGTAWHFYYRDGAADRLAIYFQGGGACWNAALCDQTQEASFDGSLTADDHPADSGGLFDFDHPGNPIADFSVAFLPYCTGDVHIGTRTVTYTRDDGSTYLVRHQGQGNTGAALDWLAARWQGDVEMVLVSGESAGAIAAAYYSVAIGELFPDAELVTVGDAAGGYRSAAVNPVLAHWGVLETLPDAAAYADPDSVNFEDFYVAAAEHRGDARLAQVNFADDSVQRHFLDLLGTPVDDFTKPLSRNLDEIYINAPTFRSFVYPGTAHAVLRTDAVYEVGCGGRKLIGWLDDLIDGEHVATYFCDGDGEPFSVTLDVIGHLARDKSGGAAPPKATKSDATAGGDGSGTKALGEMLFKITVNPLTGSVTIELIDGIL